MAKFIFTVDDKLINLDQVAKFERQNRTPKDNGLYWNALDIKGNLIGMVLDRTIENIGENIAIIPDYTRSLVMVFYLNQDESVDTLIYPIVAWKVFDSAENMPSIPISIVELPSDWCVIIRVPPEGIRYVFPDENEFSTLETAKAYAHSSMMHNNEMLKLPPKSKANKKEKPNE